MLMRLAFALLRLHRALTLGYALLRLEDEERLGTAFCLHNSWCGSPGFWIILRRAELRRLEPIAGPDLVGVLRRAAA